MCEQVFHVSELIAENPVNFIYLVGGFAESKMLQSRVKVAFERGGLQVIIPMRPQLMVVKGAVIFGLRKGSTIQSRKARFTYGFASSRHYDKKDPSHVSRGHETIEGDKYVKGQIFDSLVKQGHTIKVLESHTSEERTPLYRSSTNVEFNLYSSSHPRAKFVDEPGLTCIGRVKVPCVHGEMLTIAMAFGSTEITATATNKNTGVVVKGEIKYNFNSL